MASGQGVRPRYPRHHVMGLSCDVELIKDNYLWFWGWRVDLGILGRSYPFPMSVADRIAGSETCCTDARVSKKSPDCVS